MTYLARNATVGILVILSVFLSPSPIFASSLSSSSYIYDNIGNIQSINNTVDPSKNMTYSYDDLYRLTGATGGYSAGYGYDADGNILTKTEDQALTLTYTPSDTIASHAPKSVNGRLLKYDGNGNLIEDAFSNLKITYDYENRPVEIRKLDSNQLLAKYSYDGEGKRVKKEVYDSTIPSSPLKSTTEYMNQYYEKEVPVGQQMKIRKFYVGVAYRENGTLTYSTNDHLSSTTLLTTSSGAKQAEYRYYPYGSPIQLTIPLPPNSWIGQKRDDESGLYFLNARYYSPTYGRFGQADSVVDPTTRGNKYSYVGENPIGRSDPDGKCGPLCALPFALWEQFFGAGVDSAQGADECDIVVCPPGGWKGGELQYRKDAPGYTEDPNAKVKQDALLYTEVAGNTMRDYVGGKIVGAAVGKLAGPIVNKITKGIETMSKSFQIGERSLFLQKLPDRFVITLFSPQKDEELLLKGSETVQRTLNIRLGRTRPPFSPEFLERIKRDRAVFEMNKARAGGLDFMNTPQASQDWLKYDPLHGVDPFTTQPNLNLDSPLDTGVYDPLQFAPVLTP